MAGGYALVEAPAMDGLRSGTVGGAIAAKRFLTGYEQAVAYAAAASDPIFGVSRTAATAAGQEVSVATRGKVVVTAGTGGVTKGTRVMAEANTGKAVAWTAAGGANASVGGIAQTDASANEDCLVELAGPGALAQG